MPTATRWKPTSYLDLYRVGLNGPQWTFNPSQPLTAIPGTQPTISALIVYQTRSLGDLDGTPPEELDIDAFDVGTSSFLPDDFVKVDNGNAARTSTANTDGVILTNDGPHEAEAFGNIGSAPFVGWNHISGAIPTINGRKISAAHHSNSLAFAFYKSPEPAPVRWHPELFHRWPEMFVPLEDPSWLDPRMIGNVQKMLLSIRLGEAASFVDREFATELRSLAQRQMQTALQGLKRGSDL